MRGELKGADRTLMRGVRGGMGEEGEGGEEVTRWDRDRNSRDVETDGRSRDSHRKYDGEREGREGRGWVRAPELGRGSC